MGCTSSKQSGASAPAKSPAVDAAPPVAVPEAAKAEGEHEFTSEETHAPSEGVEAQANADLQIVLEILGNVLVGFVGETVPAVMEVLKASGEALQSFKAAVEAFKAKEAVRGLELLSEGLQTLADALKEVDTVKEQAEVFAKVLAMFKDPAQIIFHAGEQLLVNGKEILASIEKAVAAFEAQDWATFGQEIGKIIGVILSPAEGQASSSSEEPIGVQVVEAPSVVQRAVELQPGATVVSLAERPGNNVQQIFGGLLTGMMGVEAPTTPDAINEPEKVLSELTNAVDALANRDVPAGLQRLRVPLQGFLEALQAANAAAEQIENLAKVVEMFNDPDFLSDGLNNLDARGLLEDVQKAVDQFRAGEGADFGQSLGSIVANLRGPTVVAHAPPTRSGPWPFNLCCTTAS
eukprot:TRINITY_DN13329_c0_g1_i3.p1 TRINITY_DN13329_c0_g1~~TRINITY_DN13329_c0_g1_i3.p1  ORF type:complete len:406 (+),score=145.75 TRINITY_DN13329_c0_g1_i3:103-1320(+)